MKESGHCLRAAVEYYLARIENADIVQVGRYTEDRVWILQRSRKYPFLRGATKPKVETILLAEVMDAVEMVRGPAYLEKIVRMAEELVREPSAPTGVGPDLCLMTTAFTSLSVDHDSAELLLADFASRATKKGMSVPNHRSSACTGLSPLHVHWQLLTCSLARGVCIVACPRQVK